VSTIEALQERLARTLNGAGRSADRELAARIRDEGHRLVFLLAGLVRASRLYAQDNDALAPLADEVAEVLAGLAEHLGVVQLVLVEDQAYVNDVRLRVRPSEQPVIDELCAELGRHDVGGVSFHRPLDATRLKRLARAVSSEADGARPTAALRTQLAELGDVEVSGRWRFRIGGEEAGANKSYPEVLARAEQALADTLGRLSAGWMPNPLRIRRVVIDLVEGLHERPLRGALAPFAGTAARSERHLVSVCQLSLLLGRALGLGEATLADLGVAALLHDVGYLASEDPARHALAGARLLLRQRGFSEAKLRRLLAVIEHADDHRDPGRLGPAPSLFARILHVAEHYDLLVASRPGKLPLVSPAVALERMWAGRGARYDPVLLAMFVRELGLYPPGTLLELDGGSWALVVRPGAGREGWAYPVVRIVAKPDGSVVPDGHELCLFERRPGAQARRVIEPSLVPDPVWAACQARLADEATKD
jgi:hypothetical protein